MRRVLLVAAVTVLSGELMLARVARGESGETRHVGVAVHGEVGFLLPPPNGSAAQPNSTPGIASAGLGVGYDIRPTIEVEAAVSTTGSSSRATKGANGTIDYGTIIRTLLHWHGRQTGFGPLLGAGPAVITGGNFGAVPLLHVEGGVEFRPPAGFYFAAAWQLVEPLMTSRPDIDPAQCVTSDCPSRFNPRDPIYGLRMALGFSF